MNLQEEFIRSIQEHQLLVNKLVFLYADRPEDRQDLRQEILLQAWRSFPSFRKEAKFSTWLYRLGLNVALSMLHQSKRKPSGPLPDNTCSQGHSYETDDQLLHTLHQLSQVDRTILVMSMEGYTHEEISETLGITNNAMRTKLHRIRQKISKLWKS